MSEPRDNHDPGSSTEHGSDADDDVRLELKPNMSRAGHVDGGWWPRSRDLRVELPALLAAISAQLGPRVGPIARIGFGAAQWHPTGRQRLVTPTGRVAFDGFADFDADLIWVASRATTHTPLVLLVVPPETRRAHATATLRRASAADNTDLPAALLEEQRAPDQPAEREVLPAGAAHAVLEVMP
ncbi:DUF5994 family protein [Actinomycetospora straminea]|uniref:Uncharacterized protein n=1 Tax=Actinomycetospora straminea TaxID=663607 RepID=A0ABP9FDD8_9PSEU|nr:DUF5994 family protein [Actinomycetospora straminea]MDD7934775.1 DUF5994 family protein [Actinomycetospora straminea]